MKVLKGMHINCSNLYFNITQLYTNLTMVLKHAKAEKTVAIKRTVTALSASFFMK